MAEERDLPSHTIVVGASSGVGLAVAQRLADTMKVTALARRVERLEALGNSNIDGGYCDVRDIESVNAAVEAAVAANGKVSAIVYCAGAQVIKPMRIIKPADIDTLIDVNLKGALHFARHFASAKIAQPDAVFCPVSSIAAARPEPGIVTYAAAKAALDALVKGLARELAPRRAVGVAPGWLDTEMTQSQGRIYDAEFREALEKSSPLGIVPVEAVADLIVYLLSPQARHITGQTVTIDAGAVL